MPFRCECHPIHDTSFGGESERTPVEAVVEAVATVEGIWPLELELDPVAETIDPNALNRLFDHHDTSVDEPLKLGFLYHGWNVFVREDGVVRVCDPGRAVEPAPVFERPTDD